MRRGLPALIALALLAGCSSGSDDEPPDVEGPPREVARTVADLEAATRRRDYESICDDLFTRAARERAGGDECAALLRSAVDGVRQPRIRVLAIRVRGRRARVRVRTRAAAQGPIVETIELRRERGRFRIASLLP